MRERHARNRADNVISLAQYRRFKNSDQLGESLFSIVSEISRKNTTSQAENKKLHLIHPEKTLATTAEKIMPFTEKKEEKRGAVILKFPLKKNPA